MVPPPIKMQIPQEICDKIASYLEESVVKRTSQKQVSDWNKRGRYNWNTRIRYTSPWRDFMNGRLINRSMCKSVSKYLFRDVEVRSARTVKTLYHISQGCWASNVRKLTISFIHRLGPEFKSLGKLSKVELQEYCDRIELLLSLSLKSLSSLEHLVIKTSLGRLHSWRVGWCRWPGKDSHPDPLGPDPWDPAVEELCLGFYRSVQKTLRTKCLPNLRVLYIGGVDIHLEGFAAPRRTAAGTSYTLSPWECTLSNIRTLTIVTEQVVDFSQAKRDGEAGTVRQLEGSRNRLNLGWYCPQLQSISVDEAYARQSHCISALSKVVVSSLRLVDNMVLDNTRVSCDHLLKVIEESRDTLTCLILRRVKIDEGRLSDVILATCECPNLIHCNITDWEYCVPSADQTGWSPSKSLGDSRYDEDWAALQRLGNKVKENRLATGAKPTFPRYRRREARLH